jgi:hypothetical protein
VAGVWDASVLGTINQEPDFAMPRTYVWELRNPDGGSTGLEFARGKSAPTDRMLGHSLPERVNVEIRDEDGNLIAKADDLEHPAITPMSRLTIRDGKIERENVWPGPDDIDSPVILPGGEVGILKEWWNAEDEKEWRWVVEFHNNVRPE